MKSMRLSPFHTAFVISLTFLFGYIVLASMGYMLSIEPGLTIGGISRWCERIVDGIFREPANALSNLGFMLSGLIIKTILSTLFILSDPSVNLRDTHTVRAIIFYVLTKILNFFK